MKIWIKVVLFSLASLNAQAAVTQNQQVERKAPSSQPVQPKMSEAHRICQVYEDTCTYTLNGFTMYYVGGICDDLAKACDYALRLEKARADDTFF